MTFLSPQGVKKPYKTIIDVSFGDPHKAGVKPLTFARQVNMSQAMAVKVKFVNLLLTKHLCLTMFHRLLQHVSTPSLCTVINCHLMPSRELKGCLTDVQDKV